MACDGFLHRKGAPGAAGRRDVVQVVLLKAADTAAEAVIDLHADNGTAARFWMAGLAAVTRQDLAATVAATTAAAPTQLDLWARYALLNQVDWRGEGPVHALVRGLEPGDEVSRGGFLAWLLLLLVCWFVSSSSSGGSSSVVRVIVLRTYYAHSTPTNKRRQHGFGLERIRWRDYRQM